MRRNPSSCPRIPGAHAIALCAALALAGCQQAATPPPVKPAAPPAAPPSSVAPAPSMTVVPAIVVPPGVVLPSMDFPPGPLYVCDLAGGRTPIDYEPRVDKLCRRHPEMGPCQFERNACRARGGRVFTAKGEEVTPAVEAEYDRIVLRVRFQADGGGPPAKGTQAKK